MSKHIYRKKLQILRIVLARSTHIIYYYSLITHRNGVRGNPDCTFYPMPLILPSFCCTYPYPVLYRDIASFCLLRFNHSRRSRSARAHNWIARAHNQRKYVCHTAVVCYKGIFAIWHKKLCTFFTRFDSLNIYRSSPSSSTHLAC